MIRFEKPNVADAEGIAKAQIKTWQATYAGIMDEYFLEKMNIPKRARKWKKRLIDNNPEDIVFVAKENDGKIVGYIWGGKNRDKDTDYNSELFAFYVLPRYHKRGIGKTLLGKFIEEAINQKLTNMSVSCLHGTEAVKFFEHIGGEFIKSKSRQIPSNSGFEFQEDTYGFKSFPKFTHES